MQKIILAILCSVALLTHAQTSIPTIKVTAAAQTDDHAAVHEVLRAEPGVVLNSQGGSQNDISIRGSSFSGAGLSLGGMTLRNAQTEHFNADLPLPAAMLSRPKVNTGLNNQGGHLVGTVDFNLLPITGTKQIETGFGTDHRDWQSLMIQHMLSETLGISVFTGRESANGVDYDDNDYDREYLGAHMQFRENDTQVDLIISHQEKEFGARGYYGVTDALPADEQTEDNFALLSVTQGNLRADYLRTGISWREFYDNYELPTIGYRNRHRTRTSSAFFDGRTLEINGWALNWRTDVDEERIQSSGLGDHHRTRGGVSIIPQWNNDRLKITAGLRSEFYTDESPEYLPQAGIDYFISDTLTAFASYSESSRLPSYTELNYNSPGSLGNSGLKPQTSAQTELGVKGIPSETMDWKAVVFHRRTKNTIDWIMPTAGGRWIATDIGTLDAYGLEARLGWYPAQNLEMQFAYTWIYKDKESSSLNGYASRYALDYAEHLAQTSLLWRPITSLEIGTVQTLRWQTDNKVRDNGSFGADSSFVVRYTLPKADYATLAFQFSNAWDDNFQAFPGQTPAERYAGISLTLSW